MHVQHANATSLLLPSLRFTRTIAFNVIPNFTPHPSLTKRNRSELQMNEKKQLMISI